MNISQSNCQRNYTHEEGGLNIMGNNNRINITNSKLAVNVLGNGNQIIAKGCQLQIQVNGNGNSFDTNFSQVSLGINGNGNQLKQKESMIVVNHCNGFGNQIQKNQSMNLGSSQPPSHSQYQGYNYNQLPSSNNNMPVNPWALLSGLINQSIQPPLTPNYNQLQNPSNQESRLNNRQRPHQINNSNVNKREEFRNINNSANRRNTNTNNMTNNNANNRNTVINNHPVRSRGYNGGNSNNGRSINRNIPNNYPLNNGQQQNPRNHPVFENNNNRRRQTETKNLNGLQKNQLSVLPITKYCGTPIQCTICLTDICPGQKVMSLFCFHRFHSQCSSDWLRKNPTCPLCQNNVRQMINSKPEQMFL